MINNTSSFDYNSISDNEQFISTVFDISRECLTVAYKPLNDLQCIVIDIDNNVNVNRVKTIVEKIISI